MNKKKQTIIYIARMPEIVGYGIEAYADSKEEAIKLLKTEFYATRKAWEICRDWSETFARAADYFGATVTEYKLPCSGLERCVRDSHSKVVWEGSR